VNVKLIMDHLGENGFYKKIAELRNILIIADTEIVNYLREKLGVQPYILLYDLAVVDGGFCGLSSASTAFHVSAVIVASIYNEKYFFDLTAEGLKEINLVVPIFKLFSDVFVNFLSGRDLLDANLIILKKPILSYAVITAPRAGSTYFCNLLQSTGILGYPGEHIRQASATLALKCKFDYMEALRKLMGSGMTENGVFGTKFIAHFLCDFQKAGFGFQDIFSEIFQKFIYLNRSDRVAQAVSACIAQKTSVWHIYDEAKKKEYSKKLEETVFSDNFLDDVYRLYDDINGQYEYLDSLVNAHNVVPLIVDYECLTENPKKALKEVLDFLGVEDKFNALDKLKTNTKVLRSELSEQICERFRKKYIMKPQHFFADQRGTATSALVGDSIEKGSHYTSEAETVATVIYSGQAYELDYSVKSSWQEKDIEIVDYNFVAALDELSDKKLWVRGGEATLLKNGYFSCIGQEYTCGRFVDKPYPSLLEKYLDINGLNLGVCGSGVEFFAEPGNRWILDICNKGRFVIVLVMSGLSAGTSRLGNDYGVFAHESQDLYAELYRKNKVAFYDSYVDMVEKYIDGYINISRYLKVPKILLWFSGKSCRSMSGSVLEGAAGFPELIHQDIVERIKPFYDYYVEYGAKPGLPQRLTNKTTGLPCANRDGLKYNTKYPSPEMHQAVSELLLPYCKRMMSTESHDGGIQRDFSVYKKLY